MDIAEKINQEQIKFITEKNYEPKHIYLGMKEIEHLCIWAQDMFGYETKPRPRSGLEFLGMKIHEVNEDSHFNLA